MIGRKWVLLGLVTAGGVLTSLPAAAEPATANVLQIGLGFRYGFEMEDGDFNPWGPGIGLDVGYTLPSAVYLGGAFDYFFGDEQEGRSANIWQLMAEGGYDLGAGPFVLRPKLGVGFASLNDELCVLDACSDESSTEFAIAPGATLMYIGEKISLSVDLRYDMIFAEQTLNALIFSAGIGF